MRVLEPAAGDGVFIDALRTKALDIYIDAYELNPASVVLLKEKYGESQNISVKHTDTLTDEELTLYSYSGGLYERILGNPPYGAWQEYEKRKGLKKLYPDMYVKETYALFLYRCIHLLANAGRLVFIIPDTFLNLHMHTKLREFLLRNTKIREIALFPSSFFPAVNFGYSKMAIITLERSYDKDSCLANQFRILTGFRKVEDVGNAEACDRTYHFTQKDIYEHLHHAFFISDSYINIHLRSDRQRIGDIADCVTGIYSGNDKKYLRPLSSQVKNGKQYITVDKHLICSDYRARKDLLSGIDDPQHFIPVIKGGAVKYVKSDLWYIDWSKEAVEDYKTNKKARFQNSRFYFKNGIGIPMVSSSQVTAALIECKLFDQSIVGVFPYDSQWLYYLLAFFNSPTCNKLLRTINPSANNSANYIKRIPFIAPRDEMLEAINLMVHKILSDLKQGGAYEEEHEKTINGLISSLYGF